MRSCERSAGFTLLEVLIALVIFVTVMGGLIRLVSQNVRALANARDEIELMVRVESQMRAMQVDAEYGRVPDVGETKGPFEPPFDHFRWELLIDYFVFNLPESLTDAQFAAAAARSDIFGTRDALDGQSSVRVVVMRVYDQFGDEPFDPFVILIAEPDAGIGRESGFPGDDL